jgi:hypothetical protein
MPEERIVPAKNDDVSHLNLLNGAGFDGKQVTGLDAGEHARTVCTKHNLAMIRKHTSEFK